MSEMTDEEFLQYCKTHCSTPRAAFVPSQIARLIRLYGDETLAKKWDAIGPAIIDGYRNQILHMIATIEKKGITKN